MKPAILRPYHAPEVIGVTEAAQRAGRSQRTIREWCALHQIGRRIGGQWAVSQTALDMYLDGDVETLEAYLAGDRTSLGVRSYYARRSILPPATNELGTPKGWGRARKSLHAPEPLRVGLHVRRP